MYCFANQSMLPDLKAIWKECFGDEEAYIDFFFSNQMKVNHTFENQLIYMESNHTFENQLVYMESNHPVSMLTMIPGMLVLSEGSRKIYYIYGVATTREHRGKGYAASLLEYAYFLAQKENAALVLVPASESLYAYYRKLGFETAFYQNKISFVFSSDIANTNEFMWSMREVNADTYGVIRKQQFSRQGTVIWKEKELLYAYKENQFLGGKSYCIECNNKEYLLMCYAYENCLYVRETTLPDEMVQMVIYTISKNFQCQRASVRIPAFCGSLGQRTANGMILPGSFNQLFQNGYLGLTLD